MPSQQLTIVLHSLHQRGANDGNPVVRAIRVVEWVKTRVQVATMRRYEVKRESGTGGSDTSGSAVLIFDVPAQWVWRPVHSAVEKSDGRQVRGTWSDRSCELPEGCVPTLDDVIGVNAEWSGNYTVDRHSEMYLTNILSHLGICPADMLSSADTERMKREIRGMPGASVFGLTRSVCTSGLDESTAHALSALDGPGAATRRRIGDAEAGGFKCHGTSLPVQAIADCIELHSEIVQTPQGVFFNLCYRLKLPSEQAQAEPAHHDQGANDRTVLCPRNPRPTPSLDT
jgi:hypothetical protein